MDPIRLHLLTPDDHAALCAVSPGLFDNPVDPDQARAFLADPANLIVIAWDGDGAVSFASGTILRHPDKPPSLFVNEVGTRDSHLRQGLARRVLTHLFDAARARGCQGLWVVTEPDNTAALALYRSLGGESFAVAGFGWDGAFDPD